MTTALLRPRSRGNLERNDLERSLDEGGRRTGCHRQALQIMVGEYYDGGIEVGREVGERCDSDALEWAIEVPMLEAMGIACDDCGFIAVYVVGVIAMAVRMVVPVVMSVMVVGVRFIAGIMAMNVRVVSPAMTMIEHPQDIDRVRSSTVTTMDSIIFPPSIIAASRWGECRIGDQLHPVGRPGIVQTRSSKVLSL